MIEDRIYSTAELLDMLKSLYSLDGKPATNYRVAKILQISHTAVARWEKGDGTMDDDTAYRVAELLNMPPGQVLAGVYYERAKRANNTKMVDLWRDLALRATNGAALLALVIFPFFEAIK